MATEVRLPQWGMGMTEGVITKWFKAVGDEIAEGEDLVEIETAKAADTLASPASGVIAKLLVEEDEEVPVGDVIAIIAAPGEDVS